MSYRIGMDCIHLRPTPRLAHTEYCSNEALRRHVGQQYPGKVLEELWNIDFFWSIHPGPIPWEQVGRVTDMGHADFLEGGTDRRAAKPSPFSDVEQVWAFDAVQEYGLPDLQPLANFYERWHCQQQAAHPEQVITGGYYNTLVSGAIAAFGWDMLLEAATDQERFEPVLDSFFRLSLRHNQAWAKTSAPVFLQHDDMVWTSGAFMHPEFYRRVIFPRYRKLWEPLKAAGKKVLYCSDGDYTAFIDDIAAAGADGFIFEPMTRLESMVAGYGKTHVIIGSKVDCRTLTFGTTEQIAREIDATLELAMGCPGFMFAVGNHIPSNVPVENALFYYEYLSQRWER